MLDCKKALDISLNTKGTTTYHDYLKEYGVFVDNLRFVRLKNLAKSIRGYNFSFKMFDDIMKISDSSVNVEFVKPKYMLCDKMQRILNDEIKRNVNEYQYYKKIYIYGHDNEKNKAYEKLETLTNEISSLNDCRDKLNDIVSRYHEHNYLEYEVIRKKIQDMETEMIDIKNAVSETTDDIEKERLMSLYAKKYTSMINREQISTGNLDALSAAKFLPFDLIVKAPIVKSTSSISVDKDDDEQGVSTDTIESKNKNDTTVIDDKLKKKLKKAVQKSSNSQEEVEKAVKKEKRRLKRFLFKDLSECQSTKRSGSGFMTRDELLDVISQSPSLKEKLPPNYRNMKKNDLCEAIDKANM